MSAIDQLKQRQTAILQAAHEEQERKARERVTEFQQVVTTFLDQNLLTELQAEYGLNEHGLAAVTFHYRGASKTIRERYDSLTAAVLFEWISYIDSQYLKQQEECDRLRDEHIKTLSRAEPPWLYVSILYNARAFVKKHDLRDDHELQAAITAYEAQYNQMQAENQARQAENERRRQAEREAQRAALLRLAATVTTWSELRPIAHYSELNDDNEIDNALEIARTRIQRLDDERETQRLAAQAAAFRPFVYYQVYYAALAHDDDMTPYVELYDFPSLSPQPGGGNWWQPADKAHQICIPHVVKVERIHVIVHTDLPKWCPRQTTEYGNILIPPATPESLEAS